MRISPITNFNISFQKRGPWMRYSEQEYERQNSTATTQALSTEDMQKINAQLMAELMQIQEQGKIATLEDILDGSVGYLGVAGLEKLRDNCIADNNEKDNKHEGTSSVQMHRRWCR